MIGPPPVEMFAALFERLELPLTLLAKLSPAGQAALAAVDVDQITDDDMAVFDRLFGAEQLRRARLAAIPREIAEQKAAYVKAGGDLADLDDIAPAPPSDTSGEVPPET